MPSSLKVPLLYGERQPELALEEQEDIHRQRLLKTGRGGGGGSSSSFNAMTRTFL